MPFRPRNPPLLQVLLLLLSLALTLSLATVKLSSTRATPILDVALLISCLFLVSAIVVTWKNTTSTFTQDPTELDHDADEQDDAHNK